MSKMKEIRRIHNNFMYTRLIYTRTCTLTEATQCRGGTVLPGPVHAHPNEDSWGCGGWPLWEDTSTPLEYHLSPQGEGQVHNSLMVPMYYNNMYQDIGYGVNVDIQVFILEGRERERGRRKEKEWGARYCTFIISIMSDKLIYHSPSICLFFWVLHFYCICIHIIICLYT